jgi:Transposase
LDGFSVLTAVEVGGELELLVESTADLVGCPPCGRWPDRRIAVRVEYVICRSPAGRWRCVWWNRIWCLCAHFDHPAVSNGPTENLNLKIKNTKRLIAGGYRNFRHYRLRLLLNHGRIHDDHSPARIRTRRPRIAA